MTKRALITGITGQDGRYLAELLIDKGYEVFGLIRGQNNPRREEVETETPKVQLIEGDLLDMGSLLRALNISKPDEVYNLGAISFVKYSFEQPQLTADVTGKGAINLLEAIRFYDPGNNVRFYQASTSELYGKVREVPQTEVTPFYPRSPYAAAKAMAHYATINFRESYGMFACAGILFNHESPRRGREFVTRKISSSVARIKLGAQKEIVLGNLDSQRDWGFAGDYVEGMWRMLQQDEPDDFVLATGETHAISDYLDLAFKEIGIEDWRPYVKTDERFLRPTEVDLLLGSPAKAKEKLGWEPKVSFPELVKMMVASDLEIEGKKAASAAATPDASGAPTDNAPAETA